MRVVPSEAAPELSRSQVIGKLVQRERQEAELGLGGNRGVARRKERL